MKPGIRILSMTPPAMKYFRWFQEEALRSLRWCRRPAPQQATAPPAGVGNRRPRAADHSQPKFFIPVTWLIPCDTRTFQVHSLSRLIAANIHSVRSPAQFMGNTFTRWRHLTGFSSSEKRQQAATSGPSAHGYFRPKAYVHLAQGLHKRCL